MCSVDINLILVKNLLAKTYLIRIRNVFQKDIFKKNSYIYSVIFSQACKLNMKLQTVTS